MSRIKQYLIRATAQPYTIKIQWVVGATSWQKVLNKYPDAELVKDLTGRA